MKRQNEQMLNAEMLIQAIKKFGCPQITNVPETKFGKKTKSLSQIIFASIIEENRGPVDMKAFVDEMDTEMSINDNGDPVVAYMSYADNGNHVLRIPVGGWVNANFEDGIFPTSLLAIRAAVMPYAETIVYSSSDDCENASALKQNVFDLVSDVTNAWKSDSIFTSDLDVENDCVVFVYPDSDESISISGSTKLLDQGFEPILINERAITISTKESLQFGESKSN